MSKHLNEAETAAYENLIRQAVENANANEALMDGTTAPVKDIIEAGELVIAVWQDPDAANGVGALMLKGDRALRQCMASGNSRLFRVSGVKCDSYEHAVAADQVFGVHENLN
jgi:hypothetical protein